jgi:hypothetical protein
LPVTSHFGGWVCDAQWRRPSLRRDRGDRLALDGGASRRPTASSFIEAARQGLTVSGCRGPLVRSLVRVSARGNADQRTLSQGEEEPRPGLELLRAGEKLVDGGKPRSQCPHVMDSEQTVTLRLSRWASGMSEVGSILRESGRCPCWLCLSSVPIILVLGALVSACPMLVRLVRTEWRALVERCRRGRPASDRIPDR